MKEQFQAWPICRPVMGKNGPHKKYALSPNVEIFKFPYKPMPLGMSNVLFKEPPAKQVPLLVPHSVEGST